MKIDWNQKYTTIAAYVVLTAVAILLILFAFINFSALGTILKQVNAILSSFYLGLIFAYLFNPILKMCEKRIFRFKVNTKKRMALRRGLSLVLTYIIVLIIVTILILLIIPQVSLSFIDLKDKMGGYINSTVSWIDDFLTNSSFIGSEINNLDDVLSKLTDFIDLSSITSKLQELITNSSAIIKNYVPQVFNYFSGIASGFFNVIIGLFFSIYFLASKEKLIAQCKKLLRALTSQKAYNSVLELANFTDKTFGGFITGKILDSLIIGVLCFIICAICKMPYAILVSTIVGITNIIPVVGPFIGAIPGTFIIFIVDPRKAFWFIIINIVIQQLDGNVIGPKILGETTGLSAVWVLFSITVMGNMFGLLGMLIAVPIFAVLYMLLKLAVEKRLAKRELPVSTLDYYSAAEERRLYTEEETHSFASKMSKLASDIAGNHFGGRIKKFFSKFSKKKDSTKSDHTDGNGKDNNQH